MECIIIYLATNRMYRSEDVKLKVFSQNFKPERTFRSLASNRSRCIGPCARLKPSQTPSHHGARASHTTRNRMKACPCDLHCHKPRKFAARTRWQCSWRRGRPIKSDRLKCKRLNRQKTRLKLKKIAYFPQVYAEHTVGSFELGHHSDFLTLMN